LLKNQYKLLHLGKSIILIIWKLVHKGKNYSIKLWENNFYTTTPDPEYKHKGRPRFDGAPKRMYQISNLIQLIPYSQHKVGFNATRSNSSIES
jgi:hypothetical protein